MPAVTPPKDEWREADSSVLSEAECLIHGEREEQYGRPDKFFREWAMLSSEMLNISLNVYDLLMIMTLMKLLRFRNSSCTHRDSLVDAAGYIGLMERIHTGK